MNPIDPIFRAYVEGHSAILLTGRSLYDLTVDETGKLRPLMESLRRECRATHGMLLISYSMAGGLEGDSRVEGEQDRRTVREILRSHHLADLSQDQNEVARVIRGISSLSRASTDGLKWADGRPLRFCFLFEFGEHLTPGSLTNGTQTESQLVAIELAHITAQSLAMRTSGNLILFHAREGLTDELVCTALHHVRMPQPIADEKHAFYTAAATLYDKASLEDDLTPDGVVHLTTNTPNRGLESLLRASHRSGRKITGEELLARRNRDVVQLSEHTLTVLDTSRVDNLELHGVNIRTPLEILKCYSAALRRGDRSMPANVLLVGPPGTGKTDLAILTARRAGVAAYQQHSPKGGIVGETERKARIQQDTLLEWAPNVSFVDEITESLPLERNDFDGDSGASRAVTAALLTAFSNENRRGRSLVIATTNCPWRMGDAMRSRFTIIPVLHPVAGDFPGIVIATARRVAPDAKLGLADPAVAEAARVFFNKGANPRHIRGALSQALLHNGTLTPQAILLAARDLRVGSGHASAIYADLWAIQSCSSASFLPWTSDPEAYPYPEYLKGVIDPSTGETNEVELQKRIEEFRPHANL